MLSSEKQLGEVECSFRYYTELVLQACRLSASGIKLKHMKKAAVKVFIIITIWVFMIEYARLVSQSSNPHPRRSSKRCVHLIDISFFYNFMILLSGAHPNLEISRLFYFDKAALQVHRL